MTMSLEAFRQLPDEDKKTVLAARWQRARRAINEATWEQVAPIYEAELVPKIEFKKTGLPEIPNRDEAVRQLMLADDSIEAVVTRDGVKYLR